MRIKIIAVNAVIAIIIGILTFVMVRGAVSSAASNTSQLAAEAKHDSQGASARLQLDGLRMERWLAGKAAESATLDVLGKATSGARGEAATAVCDTILSAAKQAPSLGGSVPSLLVMVDKDGKTVGRNGSNLGRNEDLGYAGLKAAIAAGNSGSDVWVNPGRNDQYLASYAPVRNEAGKVVGAIAAGVRLDDELSRVSEATTGRALKLVMPAGDDWQIVANSALANEALSEAITKKEQGAKDSIKNAFSSGHATAVPSGDIIISAAPLDGLGDGKRVAIVTASPSSLIENVSGMLLPIVGGATLLGLLLVVAAGWLLGSYITQPIGVLEEGLLAIINGQTDKRFQMDHPDLGGLAFRIDQLLNQLMGVEEDNTDDEGRVSKAPTAANFSDAMGVDVEKSRGHGSISDGDTMDAASLQQLAAEPVEQYYARIYGEYISAKKSLGEPTDHISDAAFRTRIQGMEQEASTKYGKPVRYKVQTRGKEVILLAIPLG
jgi:hypothetical protein